VTVYGPARILCVIGTFSITLFAGADCHEALGSPSEEYLVSQTRGQISSFAQIRVGNNSDLDFDRVRVHFPEGREMDYGPVPKGGVTVFQSIGRAYRYAGFSVQAGAQELSLQPIDYMGERELPVGRYTYALGVDNGRLTVQLEKVK
jgi:hypothetical protein